MSDGVRADIIYFNTSSDWLFESELYSKFYSLRLLTATASSKLEAIKALGRALSRSETVIVVGGWQGETYLPATIAKAVGLNCQRVGLAGSTLKDAVLLPSGAIPLAVDGQIRGAILCRGPQAIVMIDDAREDRVRLAKEYIVPYLIKQAGLVSASPTEKPKPTQKSSSVVRPEKAAAASVEPTEAEKPKSVEQQPIARVEKAAAHEPEKTVKKKDDPQKKPRVEEIPMERVRLTLPKKKTASASTLPELKFNQKTVLDAQEEKPTAQNTSVEEASAAEPTKSEKLDEKKPQVEKIETTEAKQPDPKPKKEKSVEEIPVLPCEKTPKKAKKGKAEKPAAEPKSEKKAADVKPAKQEKPAAAAKPSKNKSESAPIKQKRKDIEPEPVLPEQVDEAQDSDEGIKLPRFPKVLTVICVIVLLLSLAAVLYIGYETFVQGSIGDASAMLDAVKVRIL